MVPIWYCCLEGSTPEDRGLSLFIALRWMQRPERVMMWVAENIQACLRIFWQLQHQWIVRDILHPTQGVFPVYVLWHRYVFKRFKGFKRFKQIRLIRQIRGRKEEPVLLCLPSRHQSACGVLVMIPIFVLHPLHVQDLILGVVGLEFGDYLFHLLHDGHLIEGFGDSVELNLVLESLFIGILRHLSNHDVGMGSGDGVLLAGQQLLIEFLAITKTGVENLDVLSAREIYHPLGKVGNAHRLTHIEDIYLAPMSHGARLENQSAGFGDEHEITYDVGVGDGDRTSLAYLFLEDGNDGAIGAQDVTKSGGDELSYSCLLYTSPSPRDS